MHITTHDLLCFTFEISESNVYSQKFYDKYLILFVLDKWKSFIWTFSRNSNEQNPRMLRRRRVGSAHPEENRCRCKFIFLIFNFLNFKKFLNA